MYEWTKTYFAEYEAFTENQISKITKNGIFLKNGVFIDFAICAENFKKQNPKVAENVSENAKLQILVLHFLPVPNPS